MGKGFSIVSSEIRKLADRTKNETNKIFPLLQNIINNTNQVDTNTTNLSEQSVKFSEIIENINQGKKIKTVKLLRICLDRF